MALAVTFLAEITKWDGKTDLLPFGVSIALVVLALGVFSYFRRDKGEGKNEAKNGEAKSDATPPATDATES